MDLPDYPTLGVLLPFIGEADEVPALGDGGHRVPVLEAKRFGAPGHQDAARGQMSNGARENRRHGNRFQKDTHTTTTEESHYIPAML